MLVAGDILICPTENAPGRAVALGPTRELSVRSVVYRELANLTATPPIVAECAMIMRKEFKTHLLIVVATTAAKFEGSLRGPKGTDTEAKKPSLPEFRKADGGLTILLASSLFPTAVLMTMVYSSNGTCRHHQSRGREVW
jgi:hypothetical protein